MKILTFYELRLHILFFYIYTNTRDLLIIAFFFCRNSPSKPVKQLPKQRRRTQQSSIILDIINICVTKIIKSLKHLNL